MSEATGSKKAKTYHIVGCEKHGVNSGGSARWSGKQLKAPRPRHKRDKFNTGCPVCKSEDVQIPTS